MKPRRCLATARQPLSPPSARISRRGAALITVLMTLFAACAIIAFAASTTLDATLISKNTERSVLLYDAAVSGVDEARSFLNGHPGDITYFPDSGKVDLTALVPSLAQAKDAYGNPIPGITRTIYSGPSGSTTGEYGIYGTVIVIAQDGFGNRAIQRGQVNQDTFAKYAYFTNSEGGIGFGGGDQLFGPVHSNDNMYIFPSGAEFHSFVTTSGNITNANSAIFDQGYRTRVRKISLPPTTALTKIKGIATASNAAFIGDNLGPSGTATTRIEFVAVDLNNDGDVTDPDEGFMRVYQSFTNPEYVVGAIPTAQLNGVAGTGGPLYATGGGALISPNCGDTLGGVFRSAASIFTSHGGGPNSADTAAASLLKPAAHCYLGGDEHLFTSTGSAFDTTTINSNMSAGYTPNQGTPFHGGWIASPFTMDARLGQAGAKRPDSLYLWPITRALNPNFKGVVFVDGRVAVSGVVRGRLTVASPYDIIVAGDVKLASDPTGGNCSDFFALFSGTTVTVADNMINSPVNLDKASGGPIGRFKAPPQAENLQAVILALTGFRVQNYKNGIVAADSCQGVTSGRGCLYLTGGVIQGTRGPVGTLNMAATQGQTGYIKRYVYNSCGLTNPPPYFPTTGYFSTLRTYDMDPVGFQVDPWYRIAAPIDSLALKPVKKPHKGPPPPPCGAAPLKPCPPPPHRHPPPPPPPPPAPVV